MKTRHRHEESDGDHAVKVDLVNLMMILVALTEHLIPGMLASYSEQYYIQDGPSAKVSSNCN